MRLNSKGGGICTTLHSNTRAARVTIVAYSDSAVKDNFVGVILWGWYMYHFGVRAVTINSNATIRLDVILCMWYMYHFAFKW